MNKRIANILVLSFLVAALETKSQEPFSAHESAKNHFFVLAGAPAIYSGFSYERLLFKQNKLKILPRAGVGFNVFKPSIGKEFDFHLGITTLYGKNHNLEIGLGSIHYLLNQANITNATHYTDYKFAFYGLIGYRYYFKKNPLAFKLGLTPVIVTNPDKWTFFPFPEIGIGFRI